MRVGSYYGSEVRDFERYGLSKGELDEGLLVIWFRI